MNLALRIPDNATVLLDTNPIIYLLEGHPLATRFEPILRRCRTGRIQSAGHAHHAGRGCVWALRAGKEALAQRYRSTLTNGPGWTLRPLDADIAVLAAASAYVTA